MAYMGGMEFTFTIHFDEIFADFFKKTVEIYFIMRYTIKGSFYSRAEIAQLVEHFTRNEGVVGSSPIFG